MRRKRNVTTGWLIDANSRIRAGAYTNEDTRSVVMAGRGVFDDYKLIVFATRKAMLAFCETNQKLKPLIRDEHLAIGTNA